VPWRPVKTISQDVTSNDALLAAGNVCPVTAKRGVDHYHGQANGQESQNAASSGGTRTAPETGQGGTAVIETIAARKKTSIVSIQMPCGTPNADDSS
jgi:hypothetical protein